MKLLFQALALLFAFTAQAQEWTTDLAAAQVEAKAQHKNILLVFSGSDWCAPCIKLEKNVFATGAFRSAAARNWILVKADFPKKKAHALPENVRIQNEQLAEKYNREGNFPFVLVLDSNGKILGRTAYKDLAAEAYIAELQSFAKTGS
ncbi:thioredoxin family protein [Flavobacterium sp.]|uniref:thioredoxin family protein n=1 Tax=Flavobacterium sp. TaxID=239 RepID=UPI0039E69899